MSPKLPPSFGLKVAVKKGINSPEASAREISGLPQKLKGGPKYA